MGLHTEKKLILSLDQGGHSSRAMVFDTTGKLIVSARQSIGVQRPRPTWVEQDGEALIQSMVDVINDVSDQLGEACSNIQVAGLATQRSNSICWDKFTGRPLSAAISWQDTRSSDSLVAFFDRNDQIHEKTGLLVSAHYGASKLRWCLDNLPEVALAAQENRLSWGPLSSYLVYRLTQEKNHYVDPVNASRTLLWNLKDCDWDSQLLEWFNVAQKVLPRCVPNKYDFGHLILARNSIPLQVVTGDQSAALFAFGTPAQGTVYINMGTGAFLQYSTGNQLVHVPKLLSGMAFHDGTTPQHTLECTVNGAGSALSLVEEQIGMDYKYAEANFEKWLGRKEEVPLYLNGVSGLGAPFWIPNYVSQFIIHETKVSADEIEDWKKIVAVGESIIFLIMVNLDRLLNAKLEINQLVLTGGLAKVDGLCQRLADLTGQRVFRPVDCEATARGTARLAVDLPLHWEGDKQGQVFEPARNEPFNHRYHCWHSALEESLQEY